MTNSKKELQPLVGRRIWHNESISRNTIPLILVLLGSALLRLVNLDYSHFQGDEISALYPLDIPFPTSLIEQLKGPIQLLVTLVIHLLTGDYGEWETRIPFSLASLLTVYVIYLFVRDAFGQRPAIWAGALAGSCGLMVAFGRIAQYQAFVMLAVSLTALFLLWWCVKDKPRYLYFGLSSFAFGILAHYDALTFLPTLLLLLILGFRSRDQWTRPRLCHLFLASLLALCLAGLFYVPFIFRPGFISVTNYLRGRVVGESIRLTFIQTNQLLDLYFPPLYLQVILLLILVGSTTFHKKNMRLMMLVVMTWFAAPFAFYMFLGGDPRSHVYMYVFPGMILASLGIDAIVSLGKSRLVVSLIKITVWLSIITFSGITYYMLVDHTIEHPWERKTILGYELPNLVSANVQGVFGFPYRRGLEQVGELFYSGELAGSVGSNERYSTVEFYFKAVRSSPPVTYFDDPGSSPPDYYFYVYRPFSLRRGLPETVNNTYRLLGTISEGNRRTIDIYAAPWKEP